jgi:hypothetical protein
MSGEECKFGALLRKVQSSRFKVQSLGCPAAAFNVYAKIPPVRNFLKKFQDFKFQVSSFPHSASLFSEERLKRTYAKVSTYEKSKIY